MKTRKTSTTAVPAPPHALLTPDSYRTVVEDLTELICRFRPDGTITYVNEVYCRFFGKTHEELIGMPWQPSVVADDLSLIEGRLRMLSPKTPVVVIENRVYDGKKRVRWMEFVNRAFFDAQGHLQEMQSVGRDITERVQAEQRLQEGEQRWKFALESSGFGVWDWDLASNKIFRSSQFKMMLGFGANEWIPGSENGWHPLVHPDDLAGTEKAVNDHLTCKSDDFVHEFRMRCKDGSWKWVMGRGKVIVRDVENRALRMTGTLEDISRRKAAEEREAHNLQLIVEGAPYTAVLEAIVRSVEAGNQGMRCSIMLADKTGTRLEMVAAPSLPEYVKKALDGTPISPDIGICGVATFTGKRVICADIRSEPRLEAYHRLSEKARLSSCWSEPVVSGTGQVLGAFACYRREIHNPDQAEIQTITAAARLAALAIEGEKRRLELLVSEERYARAMRATTDGLWDWNLITGGTYLSPRWKQMLGFDDDEPLGTDQEAFMSRLHPEDWPRVKAARQEHFDKRVPYQVELRLRTKKGDFRWFLTRGEADWDEQGQPIRMTGTISDISDRKQAEQALRESEQRFRAVFEQAAVGVAEMDTVTGRFLNVNQRICEINLRTRAEMLKLTFKELTCAEDLPRSLERMEALKAGKIRNYNLEKRNILPDGTVKWVNLTVSPMWLPGEEPLRHVAVVEDITERKRVEQALQESEQRFRAVFEQAAVGVAVIDTPTGRFLSVNQRMCEINRRSSEEMLKLTFMDITCSDDLQDDLSQMEALKAGKIPSFKLEKRNVGPDGEQHWIHLTVSPMWRPGEPPLRHIAVVEDITERKQVELNYLRELAYNQALVSHTSAFIAVLDLEGRFVHANSAFSATMGYAQEQIIGKTPWELGLMDEAETARSQERFARLMRGEENPPADSRMRTKSGEWRYVEIRSTVTRKPDGTYDRIVVTGTDMTERNRLQQEVLRVVEQEQARVGHDLHDGVGQTMTGIVSLVEALESDLAGDTRQQAQRIHELLRQSVSEVRRMSHGLSPTGVKYRGLVGALRLLAETVRTNFRTPCECNVDPAIAPQANDIETHLFRIAQEAVNNALRHGKPSQVKISLQQVGPKEAELRIEDDGAGMKKPKSGKKNGIGVRVMDYRANLIGARLTIKNKVKRGVVVTCRFDIAAGKK
ncbi:PAS domain S-box protein [Prosthecobacter vanneervenii]|uniref:histidine kinase n=1 Tax=Prosthecobacter vanneervenii TaxID=48466 RepID=A0A7W7YED6_9BACT|nr:PAS domain S-box protein [Prosthecobacter vanneervenii]MBB5034320.1 PAS domain S-box-containing protein [Prosthecobacter vanneervenii]